MNDVHKKFENFQKFMTTIPGISAQYTVLLNQCNYDIFSKGLQSYGNDTVEEIVKKLCNKSGIQIPNVDELMKAKFVRYIEYFQKVSKIDEK